MRCFFLVLFIWIRVVFVEYFHDVDAYHMNLTSLNSTITMYKSLLMVWNLIQKTLMQSALLKLNFLHGFNLKKMMFHENQKRFHNSDDFCKMHFRSILAARWKFFGADASWRFTKFSWPLLVTKGPLTYHDLHKRQRIIFLLPAITWNI